MNNIICKSSSLCLSLLLFTGITMAQSDDIRLINTEGTVHIQCAPDPSWILPETNMPLLHGNMIKTAAQSSAEIMINGKGLFHIEENSQFKIGAIKQKEEPSTLYAGTLLFKIKNLLKPKEKLLLETSTAILAIRGTEGAIESIENTTTQVGLFEGVLEVLPRQGTSETTMLTAGYETRIDFGKAPVQPMRLSQRMILHQKKMTSIRTRFSAMQKKWHIIQKKRRQKIRQKLYPQNHD